MDFNAWENDLINDAFIVSYVNRDGTTGSIEPSNLIDGESGRGFYTTKILGSNDIVKITVSIVRTFSMRKDLDRDANGNLKSFNERLKSGASFEIRITGISSTEDSIPVVKF